MNSHQKTQAQAVLVTQNLVDSLGQNFDGLIDSINIALWASSDEITRQISAGKIDAPSITRYLHQQRERLPHVAFIRASNERGEVIYGSGIYSPPYRNDDRDFFISLRDNPKAGLFVAKPVIGRADNKWIWVFARRINKPDGSFSGVVWAVINIDEIEKMLAQIQTQPGDSIALRDAELGLIARNVNQLSQSIPPGDKKLSQPFVDALKADPQKGTYISGASSIDSISRIHSYRRSAKYGFTLNVGISVESAMAAWRQQAWITTGLAIAFVLALLVYARQYSRYLHSQKQHVAELESGQQALRDSEAKFRSIIESAPVAMAVNDEHGNITFLNRKFIETFGYTLDDIPTLTEWWPRAYPDPDYRQRVAQEWQAAAKKAQRDKFEPMEYKVTCKDGGVRDIRFNMAPLGSSSLVILYDITERKQAELALWESNEKLRLFIHYAPSAIAMFDRDMRYIAFSRRWLTDYGLGEREIAGLSHYEIFPDLPERWKEIHHRCLAGAVENCDEDPFPHTDGTVDWVRWEAHPWLTGNGDIGGLIIFSEIVTRRKQAEIQIQRLNRFFATLSETNEMIVRETEVDALFQKTCDIVIQHAGFGLAWIGMPEGELIKVAVSAGPAQAYLEGMQISVRADQPEGQGPTGRTFRSGEHFICNDFLHDPVAHPWAEKASRFGIKSSATFPLRKAGKVVAILNIYSEEAGIFQEAEVKLLDEMAMDISFALDHLQQHSDLHQTLASLEKSQQELEERVRQRTAQLEVAKHKAEVADRVKSAFLATMSHELRTPLNSIIGFTGVLLQGSAGPLVEEQRKQLGIVKSSGQHLLELVNDILDISKIEAGELNITLEQVDLPALLLRMADRFRPQFEAQGLSLKLELDADMGKVRSNERRLEQVVGNLISNALKFTDRGEVRVTCRSENEFIKITVSDTGIGIADSDIAKLFKPFVQLEVRPERVTKGTGLGLAISRRIVEALGGEMGVESVMGAGSRFYFTLPVAGVPS